MSGKVLDRLYQMQQVADKIDLIDKEKSEAAQTKERVESNLADAHSVLEAKQLEFHAVDMERRKQELQLKEEKERQQRIKGRTGDVKNSREYQAVRSESNSVKQAITGVEEQLLAAMESAETLGAEVEEAKKLIERIEADAADANEKYDEICASNEAETIRLNDEERSLMEELPPDATARYKMIRSRRGGVAVVEAKDEACTACFMRVPPQVYNQLLREDNVVQCPNCHRILVPPRASE